VVHGARSRLHETGVHYGWERLRTTGLSDQSRTPGFQREVGQGFGGERSVIAMSRKERIANPPYLTLLDVLAADDCQIVTSDGRRRPSHADPLAPLALVPDQHFRQRQQFLWRAGS
jgi:hypothetical protein